MPRHAPPGAKETALEMYAGGIVSTLIADAIGVHFGTVCKWVRVAGLTRPHDEAMRKYTADLRFFESIDSEEKAYWLGFVYADGCVTENALQVVLAVKDATHLEGFRTALRSSHPISERNYKYAEVMLKIRSQELVDDLAAQGIHPRKTYSNAFPHRVPAHLRHHFIRGVFDGDGTASIRNGHCNMGWIGTEAFLAWTASVLTEQIGLPHRKLYPTQSEHVARLNYSGNQQCAKVRDWMYQGATIWLPRKREILDRIVVCETWPDVSSRVDYAAMTCEATRNEHAVAKEWLDDPLATCASVAEKYDCAGGTVAKIVERLIPKEARVKVLRERRSARATLQHAARRGSPTPGLAYGAEFGKPGADKPWAY